MQHPRGRAEKRYSDAHKQTQSVVERAFGLSKQRYVISNQIYIQYAQYVTGLMHMEMQAVNI